MLHYILNSTRLTALPITSIAHTARTCPDAHTPARGGVGRGAPWACLLTYKSHKTQNTLSIPYPSSHSTIYSLTHSPIHLPRSISHA